MRWNVLGVVCVALLVGCGRNEPDAGKPGTGLGSGASGVTVGPLAATVSPTSLAFGDQYVFTTSASRPVTVSNTTASAFTVTPVISGRFSVSPSAAFTLAPGASQTLSVSFMPNAVGPATGTLTLTTNEAGNPSTAVTLSGTGTNQNLDLSHPFINFNEQRVGTTSASRTVTVTNNGAYGTLNVTAISTFGPFAISPNTPFSLAPGQSRVFGVTFSPTATGNAVGWVSFFSNDPDTPEEDISLSGVGINPTLSVSPSSVAFGEQRVNTTSIRGVTLTNTGTLGTLTVTGITVTGPFMLAAPPTFPFSLAPGESRSVSVSFRPPSAGSHTGTYSIDCNDPNPPTVALSGTGTDVTISVSPSSVAFGEQRVGTTSAPQTVTVTNTGTVGTLNVTGLGTGGPPFALSSNAAFSLAPGASRSVTVTFSPTALGNFTANLGISSNDPARPGINVPLSGAGVNPTLSVTPSALGFGEQRVGTTSAPLTVTVTNTGTAGTLNVTGIGITGPFALSSTSPFSLAPGASRSVTVTFSPTALGAVTGNLGISSNDPARPNANLALTGTGVNPTLSVSPSALGFGEQRVGTRSAPQTVTLANTATAGSITVTALAVTAPFVLVSPPPLPFTLPPGGSASLGVAFSPTAVGQFTSNLTVTSDAAGSPATVALGGTGVNPGLAVSPASLAFGEQRVGTSSAPLTVTLANPGTAGTITVSALSVAAPFALVSPPPLPFTLAAGQSQTLSVTFSPTAAGSATGTLTLTSDASGSPSTVALSGSGTNATLSLSPSSLAFGEQQVGSTSAAQVVTLSNSGSAGTLTVTNVNVAAPFALVPPPVLPFALAPGEVRSLTVVFRPVAEGAATGTLSVASNDPNGTGTVSLSGTGVRPVLSVSPTAVVFGEQRVGTTSTARAVTVSNTGTGTLSVAAPALSAGSVFSVTPSTAFTLAPGQSRALSVTFSPTAEGGASDTLSLSSNDADNPTATVALSGRGVRPSIAVSPTSLDFGNQGVGTSTSRTVTVNNAGTGPLDLSSIVITSGTPFSVSPSAPVVLAPGQSLTLTVTFSPTSLGSASALITLRSDDPNRSVVDVPLTGTGVSSQPVLSLDRNAINFGDVPVGSESAPVNVTLTNTGNANLDLTSATVTGPFVVSGLDVPSTVAPSARKVFSVAFRPTQAGSQCGSGCSLAIASNASGSPAVIALSGNGTVAAIALSQTSIDFGNQRVLSPSPAQVLIISNTGTAPLDIRELVLSNSAFSVSSPQPPPSPGSPLRIAPGEQRAVSLTVTPTAVGAVSGRLFIISNAAQASAPVELMAQGVDGQAALTPTVVAFSSVDVGTGAQQSVVLRNVGGYALTIVGVTAPAETAFTVSGLTVGLVLRPGEDWPFTVAFAPTRRGFMSGAVVVQTDARINPNVNLQVSGTGVAPRVELVPATVAFGRSNVGASVTRNLSIRNTGERALLVSNLSLEDAAGSPGGALDFSVDGAVTFPLLVPPGMSTTVQLRFAPRAVGQRQARAIVYTNDRVAEASLTGEGTSPMLQLSQPSLDFGDVRVSTSSAPRTLRLTNTGSGPLTVTALRVTGADASTFLHTVPSLPHTLQPQGSLDVPVVFTPNAERSFSAQFVVESDDPRMPAVSVPMTGSGVPVRVTVSAASLDFGNQLIHRASAPRTVRVTNGSDGNVTLTALSLESGSSQFSLALMEVPVVLAPGQHQDVTVTFTPRTEAGVAAVLKLTFAELPRPLEVSLRGTGILTVLSIQPSPLSFGTVRTGSPKQELPLTLTNVSNEPIVLAAPQVKSRTGEPFTYDAASVQGRTINPGGTLIVQVGYQPVNETLSETTLTFGTTTPPLPQAAEARLTGRATGSFVSVDTERVDFGLVDLGAPVEPKTVTLTNRSDQPRQVVAKLRDVEGSPYTLQTSALANPIPAGGTATLTVSFAPTKAGPAENELQVFLQGESAAEVTVPVVGEVRSRGCGCGTTDAGSAGVMALLTLLGLGLRRRRA